jgi:hypothetical protein
VTYAYVEDVAATWEQYARLAAALAGPAPQGLIVHTAGPTDEGFRIIAVWESEEAWARFQAERLDDSAAPATLTPPVRRAMSPAHIVIGQASSETGVPGLYRN